MEHKEVQKLINYIDKCGGPARAFTQNKCLLEEVDPEQYPCLWSTLDLINYHMMELHDYINQYYTYVESCDFGNEGRA